MKLSERESPLPACYGGLTTATWSRRYTGCARSGGCPRPARSSDVRQPRDLARVAAGRHCEPRLRLGRRAAADTPRSPFPRTPSHRPASTASGRSTRSAPSACTSPSGVASNRPQYTSFMRASMHTRIRARRPRTAARPLRGPRCRRSASCAPYASPCATPTAILTPVNRARTAAVGQAVELSQAQPALSEHLLDHRQHQVRVSALRFRRALDDCARR